MSKKEKLLNRFKCLPNDFTFDELEGVFAIVGFSLDNKGSTSGSRVSFTNGEDTYCTHKPHPGKELKRPALIDAYKYLLIKGLI